MSGIKGEIVMFVSQKWVLLGSMFFCAGSADAMLTLKNVPSFSQWWGAAASPLSTISNSLNTVQTLGGMFSPTIRSFSTNLSVMQKAILAPGLIEGVLKYMTGEKFSNESFVNAVKAALDKQHKAQQQKEKTEVVASKKTPMKYTFSILHLADWLEKQNKNPVILPLIPLGEQKTKEKWLWNDGVLKIDKKRKYLIGYKNEKSYVITYKNRKYVSTWDDKNKIWVTTKENQMSLENYYSYLLDKNPKALGNFFEFLIEQTITAEYQKTLEMLNNKCDRGPALIQLFKNILLNEEAHKDKVVFYNARASEFDLLTNFIRLLNKYLNIMANPMIRSSLEGHPKYKKMEEYEDPWTWRSEYYTGHGDFGLGNMLMSVNLALFGNMGAGSERWSTIRYFLFNVSSKTDVALNLAEQIGAKVGLLGVKEKLGDLLPEYKKMGGKLRQIFISPDKVDDLTYESGAGGIPTSDKSSSYTTGKGYKRLRAEKSGGITLGERIKEARAGYQNFYNINGTQARLLSYSGPFLDPEKAKEYGVEIFEYCARQSDCKEQEKLAEKMDKIVRSMIVDALEKGKLKAEDVKLLELKQAVQKMMDEKKMKDGAGSSAGKSGAAGNDGGKNGLPKESNVMKE